MVRVAPINLANNPRTLWFSPGDLDIAKGEGVVVKTARGLEYGLAASDCIEVSDKEIKALKSPLKPVVRKATDQDVEFAASLDEKGKEALVTFKEMVAESDIDMHPVSVEFLLDGDKAIFYFEAEERVDFRELVRKLASVFHVRIDMRQIGVRDEARIVGGIGHCGQELCCKRLGGEFCPVSIRMAKEQDLSLNPQKISGLCGRLMCCLRYEYEAYKDFKGRAPKVGAVVNTPVGSAKVVDLDVPREVITVKGEDEKTVKVPLSGFEPAAQGSRPDTISDDAWDVATADVPITLTSQPLSYTTSQFTTNDKLNTKGVQRREPSSTSRTSSHAGRSASSSDDGSSRVRVSRSSKDARMVSKEDGSRKMRRRRSTKISVSENGNLETTHVSEPASSQEEASPARTRRIRSVERTTRKPSNSTDACAHVSGEERGERTHTSERTRTSEHTHTSERTHANERSRDRGHSADHRTRRGSGGEARNADQTSDAQRSKKKQGSRRSGKQSHDNRSARNEKRTAPSANESRKSTGARPGQKSSGLARGGRASQAYSAKPDTRAEQGSADQHAQGGKEPTSHRRTRSRSHRSGGKNAQRNTSADRSQGASSAGQESSKS